MRERLSSDMESYIAINQVDQFISFRHRVIFGAILPGLVRSLQVRGDYTTSGPSKSVARNLPYSFTFFVSGSVSR